MENTVLQRIEEIRRQLFSAAAERWGRAPQIIAVTKNVDAPRINGISSSGIVRLGENRVQEIMGKLPYLDASFQIDLIGRLQNNKVKYIIDNVAMIQSLDRMSLAQEIDRRAQQCGRRMPVLVQVNIGSEPQKGGVAEPDALGFVRAAAELPGLEVRGLMAVMPDIDDDEQLRPYFVKMRRLFDRIRDESVQGVLMEELSMGMSGDYILAAQEGATHVRIGSAIFGSRTNAAYQDLNEEMLKGDKRI